MLSQVQSIVQRRLTPLNYSREIIGQLTVDAPDSRKLKVVTSSSCFYSRLCESHNVLICVCYTGVLCIVVLQMVLRQGEQHDLIQFTRDFLEYYQMSNPQSIEALANAMNQR